MTTRNAGLLLAQVCCVAFAGICAFGAFRTIRDGFHITDTKKVRGVAARIVGAGAWLALAAAFLALGFVALPARAP